ncbi:MAG: hypothetical protein ABFD50_10490, partial [Smithella sp.]
SMFEIIHSVPDNVVWDLWIDGAFTEKTDNDPTGIDLIARIGNDIVVRESYDVYKKLPDVLAFIIELEKAGLFDKQKSRIFIEPKASGHPLAQYIEKDTEYNFVLIGEANKNEAKLVREGKKARHEMIKPKAESHRIKLLKGNWNDGFITQICGYPKAAHDEHVDNLGYAINHYFMNENTFIAEYALKALAKKITGAINIFITSTIQTYKISTGYEENDAGDVQLFDYPYKLHNNRYICVLVLKDEGERGGDTAIIVFDRLNTTVAALYRSDTITPQKAGKKALLMAHLYDEAKLAVAVKKEVGETQTEGNDLSHIAISEIRKVRYNRIYSRLSVNNIKLRREKEYGFEINRSATREIFYNLKEKAETAKISEVPMGVYEEISILERKKETGEVNAREGHQVNTALAYSIALKINDEMYDKVTVKKADH